MIVGFDKLCTYCFFLSTINCATIRHVLIKNKGLMDEQRHSLIFTGGELVKIVQNET